MFKEMLSAVEAMEEQLPSYKTQDPSTTSIIGWMVTQEAANNVHIDHEHRAAPMYIPTYVEHVLGARLEDDRTTAYRTAYQTAETVAAENRRDAPSDTSISKTTTACNFPSSGLGPTDTSISSRRDPMAFAKSPRARRIASANLTIVARCWGVRSPENLTGTWPPLLTRVSDGIDGTPGDHTNRTAVRGC